MRNRLLQLILTCKIKSETRKSDKHVESYKERVLSIKDNPSLKENFTAGEIACSLFNFDLAMKNLTDQEFSDVMDVYESYLFSNQTLELNYEEFLDFCEEIIQKYNAIAPYHKFSGLE